jgi:hypothetical protein
MKEFSLENMHGCDIQVIFGSKILRESHHEDQRKTIPSSDTSFLEIENDWYEACFMQKMNCDRDAQQTQDQSESERSKEQKSEGES